MLILLNPRMQSFFKQMRSGKAVCDYINATYTGCYSKTDLHSPHPLMVLAFTEAKLGNKENANSVLDRYYNRTEGVPEVPRHVVEQLL